MAGPCDRVAASSLDGKQREVRGPAAAAGAFQGNRETVDVLSPEGPQEGLLRWGRWGGGCGFSEEVSPWDGRLQVGLRIGEPLSPLQVGRVCVGAACGSGVALCQEPAGPWPVWCRSVRLGQEPRV